MTLSENNRKILLEHIRNTIEEYAEGTSSNLLNAISKKSLSDIKEGPKVKDELNRFLVQYGYDLFFDFLNVIDGTVDPSDEFWTGVTLIDMPKDPLHDIEFLHDEL